MSAACRCAAAPLTPGTDDWSAIRAAIDAAAENGTVELGEGTFYLTNTLTVAKAVTIRGAGRGETFLNGSKVTEDNVRCFYIDNAAACFSSLTICGCTNNLPGSRTTGINGPSVYLKDGKLDDVRITGCYQNAYYQRNGVGLYMEAGIVTNSMIDGNSATHRYGGMNGVGIYASGGTIVDSVIANNGRAGQEFYGGGIYMAGGVTLLRCKVEKNYSTSGHNSSNTRGIGVCVAHSSAVIEDCEIVSNGIHGVSLGGGTMRNSLVAGHKTTATDYTAGVDLGGGTLVNCTIANNEAANSFAGLKMTSGTAVNNIICANGSLGNLSVSKGTFNTNLTDEAVSLGVGNLVGIPCFTDASAGDYRLALGSPAIDAAAPRSDVTHDLNAVARPQRSAPDIGCYEFADAGGELACAASLDSNRMGEGTVPNARAQTAGGDGSAITYQWYLDDILVAGETGATYTPSSVAAGSHTIHVVVTQSGSSVAGETVSFVVLPRKTYVRANGGNVYPYAREQDAARTVADAVDALWSDATATSEIDIGEGTFPIAKALDLTKPIRVVGKGRDATILDASAIKTTNVRCAYLGHDNSVLKDLTVSGCTNNISSGTGINGLGVYLAKGTLENVCLTKIFQDAYYQKDGTALYMTAGTVTNCVIDSNGATSRYGSMNGVGVYASGGKILDSVISNNQRRGAEFTGAGLYLNGAVTVRRCRIVGNNSNGSVADNARAMGINMAGGASLVEDCLIASNAHHAVTLSSGTLRNCLIIGHVMSGTKFTAGVQMSGGRLEHCTIADNDAPNAFAGLSMTEGTAINNIIWSNGTTADALVSGGTFRTNVVSAASSVTTADAVGTITADPKLDGAPASYRLAKGSAAIDAAAPIGVEHDLDGLARPQRDGYDIGCYELEKSAEPEVSISAPVTEMASGGTLAATAKIDNIEEDEATFTWTLSGAASETVSGQGAAYKSYSHVAAVAGTYTLALTVTYEGKEYAATDKASFAVKPSVTYVSTTGGNVSPYDTPANAARSVNDALDAIWQSTGVTTTVHVAAGDYEMTKSVSLSYPVRICGAGRDVTALHGTGISDIYRGFEMTSAGAALRDLTVCGVTNNMRSDGIAIKMTDGLLENVRITKNWSKLQSGRLIAVGLCLSGGTVTNCVIDHNSGVSSYGVTQGLGIYMTGGTVVDCEIAHNSMSRPEYYGQAFYVGGGTVLRCNIHHNYGTCSTETSYSRGGALAICGGTVADSFVTDATNGVYIAGGTLRNSVIARCHSTVAYAGGLRQEGGTVVNCTIVGNTSADPAKADCTISSGTSKNNIAQYATVTGGTCANNVFNVDPKVKNNGKFTLRPSSPAIGAADESAWTWGDLGTAKDVNGKARVWHYGKADGHLDCGACAYVPNGLMLIVR